MEACQRILWRLNRSLNFQHHILKLRCDLLAHLQQRITLATDDLEKCLAALHTPVPRVSLGQRLIGLAHSAIDISDGLLADLGHILERSKAAAVIKMDAISRSTAIEKHLPHSLAVECLLAGGDDYELCFTAPRSKRARIEKLSDDLESGEWDRLYGHHRTMPEFEGAFRLLETDLA